MERFHGQFLHQGLRLFASFGQRNIAQLGRGEQSLMRIQVAQGEQMLSLDTWSEDGRHISAVLIGGFLRLSSQAEMVYNAEKKAFCEVEFMPRSKRPRRERTHDWQHIQQYTRLPGVKGTHQECFVPLGKIVPLSD